MPTAHVLVLGGARSGKTSFAEQLATRIGDSPVYLATAEVLDDEMRERVLTHRRQRQGRFTTVEEPLEVTEAIIEASTAHDVVLVDCLTLWITNLLGAGADVAGTDRAAHRQGREALAVGGDPLDQLVTERAELVGRHGATVAGAPASPPTRG